MGPHKSKEIPKDVGEKLKGSEVQTSVCPGIKKSESSKLDKLENASLMRL